MLLCAQTAGSVQVLQVVVCMYAAYLLYGRNGTGVFLVVAVLLIACNAAVSTVSSRCSWHSPSNMRSDARSLRLISLVTVLQSAVAVVVTVAFSMLTSVLLFCALLIALAAAVVVPVVAVAVVLVDDTSGLAR
jgi:hypothetical protein